MYHGDILDNNFMSFRSHRSPKLRQSGYSSNYLRSSSRCEESPERYNTYANLKSNPNQQQPSNSSHYTKKQFYQPNLKTKESIEDILGLIGNRIKSNKSTQQKFINQELLGLSRASFFEETSILNYPTSTRNKPLVSSRLEQLYNQLNNKQEQISALQNENQCLKLILTQEVKRVDEENYDKISNHQQEIEHLMGKIELLRSQGCLTQMRANCNEYELQLQDHISQYQGKLKENESYKEELESIITKLYRQNLGRELGVGEHRSQLIGRSLVTRPIATRIRECISMIDQFAR